MDLLITDGLAISGQPGQLNYLIYPLNILSEEMQYK